MINNFNKTVLCVASACSIAMNEKGKKFSIFLNFAMFQKHVFDVFDEQYYTYFKDGCAFEDFIRRFIKAFNNVELSYFKLKEASVIAYFYQ